MKNIENIYNRIKNLNTGEYIADSFETDNFIIGVDRRRLPLNKVKILNLSFYEKEQTRHRYLTINCSENYIDCYFSKKLESGCFKILNPKPINSVKDFLNVIESFNDGICGNTCSNSEDFIINLIQLLDQVENYVDFCRYECDI